MHRILLLGAGFSRNWGCPLAKDVFDQLLMFPEIRDDPVLKAMLWETKSSSGFEACLEQLQRQYAALPSNENASRLSVMQKGVTRVFDDMNRGFLDDGDFSYESALCRFTAKFDAIFTLNQDVLLEYGYKDRFDVGLLTPQRWNSVHLPGMKRVPSPDALRHDSWAHARWEPLLDTEYQIHPHIQPIFKLHGSSNWRTSNGFPLLVMGGSKDEQISQHPILTRYADEFRGRLCRGDSRLLIIGYGFRDQHINRTIADAVYQHGLKFFNVSPEGSDHARSLNQGAPGPFGEDFSRNIALMVHKYDLQHVFETGLFSASSHSIREIFRSDTSPEAMRLIRFLDD